MIVTVIQHLLKCVLRYDKNGFACSCLTHAFEFPVVTTGVHGSWTAGCGANKPPFVLNCGFTTCPRVAADGGNGVDDGAAAKARGVGV